MTNNRLKIFFVSFIWLIFALSCHLPDPGVVGSKVYVVSDYLHNGLLIQRTLTNGFFQYQYYSFIDLNYYLEGHHAFADLYHAIFEESRSAVEIGEIVTKDSIETVVRKLPYAQIPDGWLFYVTEDRIQNGEEAMRRIVLGSKGDYLTNRFYGGMEFKYYESERSWTGFYNCAHFSADMLDGMGVDIHSGWYTYNNDLFRFQLNQLTPQLSFTN